LQFITILAGANFRPADAKAVLRELESGAQLRLERDPENAYDSNAVKVLYEEPLVEGEGIREHFIGFVAKADNPVIAAMLDGEPGDPDAPYFAEGHTPEVTRCEILDFVSGDLKPTIVIEIHDGFELGTLVRGEGADDSDFLSGEGDEASDDEE